MKSAAILAAAMFVGDSTMASTLLAGVAAVTLRSKGQVQGNMVIKCTADMDMHVDRTTLVFWLL